MINLEYKIVDVDLWEKDAILELDGDRYYFQFDGEYPTLKDFIEYNRKEVQQKYQENRKHLGALQKKLNESDEGLS